MKQSLLVSCAILLVASCLMPVRAQQLNESFSYEVLEQRAQDLSLEISKAFQQKEPPRKLQVNALLSEYNKLSEAINKTILRLTKHPEEIPENSKPKDAYLTRLITRLITEPDFSRQDLRWLGLRYNLNYTVTEWMVYLTVTAVTIPWLSFVVGGANGMLLLFLGAVGILGPIEWSHPFITVPTIIGGVLGTGPLFYKLVFRRVTARELKTAKDVARLHRTIWDLAEERGISPFLADGNLDIPLNKHSSFLKMFLERKIDPPVFEETRLKTVGLEHLYEHLDDYLKTTSLSETELNVGHTLLNDIKELKDGKFYDLVVRVARFTRRSVDHIYSKWVFEPSIQQVIAPPNVRLFHPTNVNSWRILELLRTNPIFSKWEAENASSKIDLSVDVDTSRVGLGLVDVAMQAIIPTGGSIKEHLVFQTDPSVNSGALTFITNLDRHAAFVEQGKNVAPSDQIRETLMGRVAPKCFALLAQLPNQ